MKRKGLALLFVFQLIFQLIAPCLCAAAAPTTEHCAKASAPVSPCRLHSKSIERPQAVRASTPGCCCAMAEKASAIAPVSVPGGVLPAQIAVENHADFSIVAAPTTVLPALLPFHSQPLILRI